MSELLGGIGLFCCLGSVLLIAGIVVLIVVLCKNKNKRKEMAGVTVPKENWQNATAPDTEAGTILTGVAAAATVAAAAGIAASTGNMDRPGDPNTASARRTSSMDAYNAQRQGSAAPQHADPSAYIGGQRPTGFTQSAQPQASVQAATAGVNPIPQAAPATGYTLSELEAMSYPRRMSLGYTDEVMESMRAAAAATAAAAMASAEVVENPEVVNADVTEVVENPEVVNADVTETVENPEVVEPAEGGENQEG